jgi:acyl-CoA synthetase (AMP-forming)/AMP-acid ligase II
VVGGPFRRRQIVGRSCAALRKRTSRFRLVSHGTPGACTVRIVDPATCVESPAGVVGEIWVHGDNVAAGYWRNPELTEHTFGARLPHPSPGTPAAISVSTDDGEQPVRRSTCAERYRQHEFARLEVCV